MSNGKVGKEGGNTRISAENDQISKNVRAFFKFKFNGRQNAKTYRQTGTEIKEEKLS